MVTKSITLKDEIINYSVIYKNKKNISLKINGNKEICVYAPIGISYDYIEELLKSKENWIIKNIKKIDTNNLNDGTYIIYRGRKLLKIVEEAIIEEIVKKDDLIIIRSRSTDILYVNDLISRWYLENANNVIDPNFQVSKEWLKENGLSILQVN